MRKKKIWGIMAFVTLFIPALLLLTGCPRHVDSLYGVKVTADGNGGAFAVYEDELGGLIYAQKISPDGKAVWGEKGVRLVESNSQFYNFPFIQVISDGSGGAITAMPSTPSSIEPENSYYVFKLDSQGQVDFNGVFQSIDQIVSDGSGGVIFEYSPDEAELFIERIDSNGDFPWGRDGVSLTHSGNTRQIAGDGLGGAVIIREELRYPEGAQPGETFSRGYIYAQRIDSQGQFSWGEEGVLLYTTPESTYAESLQITSDGSGGAIVIWHQVPNRRIEDGSPESLMMDVLAQKINASGKVLWQENGLPLEINKAVGTALPVEPRVVSDDSGGAIIVWRDMRFATGNSANLYAQRIDGSGNIMWQPGGVNVSIDAINPNHVLVSDGAGGAIVSYFFSEPRKNLHLQKLAADGKTVWPEDGVLVSNGDYAGYSVVPDGQGGVIVGWGVGKGTLNSEKAYVQRVSTEGKLLWGENGIRLNKGGDK